MKRLITVILILALALPAVSLADPAEVTYHYSIYGNSDYSDGWFPGVSFAVDLYMTAGDLNAYIIITTWDGHDMTTLQKQCAIKSKADEKKKLYFVFPDDTYYTGYYDGEYEEYFWLDMGGRSLRLHDAAWFNPYDDMRDVQ